MNKDIYDSLSDKERCMYDELAAFSKRLAERMEDIKGLLDRIVKEADA
jgi:hypothetical protein